MQQDSVQQLDFFSSLQEQPEHLCRLSSVNWQTCTGGGASTEPGKRFCIVNTIFDGEPPNDNNKQHDIANNFDVHG